MASGTKGMIGIGLLVAGVFVTFIGLYYFSKSTGESACASKPATTDADYGGGIAGIVIGVILIIVGVVMKFALKD